MCFLLLEMYFLLLEVCFLLLKVCFLLFEICFEFLHRWICFMATMRGHASLLVVMFRCGEVLCGLKGVDDTEVDLDIVIVVLKCEL
jgi:hypothetical protein